MKPRSSPGRVERCIEDFVEAAVRFLYSRVVFKLAAFVGLREHSSLHAVRLFQSLWSHAEPVLVLRVHIRVHTDTRVYIHRKVRNSYQDYYATHTSAIHLRYFLTETPPPPSLPFLSFSLSFNSISAFPIGNPRFGIALDLSRIGATI